MTKLFASHFVVQSVKYVGKNKGGIGMCGQRGGILTTIG